MDGEPLLCAAKGYFTTAQTIRLSVNGGSDRALLLVKQDEMESSNARAR